MPHLRKRSFLVSEVCDLKFERMIFEITSSSPWRYDSLHCCLIAHVCLSISSVSREIGTVCSSKLVRLFRLRCTVRLAAFVACALLSVLGTCAARMRFVIDAQMALRVCR